MHYDIALVCYIILILWVFAVLVRTADLYYDTQFLYLKGLGRNARVPLSSIRKIQLTGTRIKIMGVVSWKYRVEFDRSVGLDDQPIWEIIGGKKIDEFAAVVKEHNKDLIVLHRYP